jgi:hypothetical protein
VVDEALKEDGLCSDYPDDSHLSNLVNRSCSKTVAQPSHAREKLGTEWNSRGITWLQVKALRCGTVACRLGAHADEDADLHGAVVARSTNGLSLGLALVRHVDVDQGSMEISGGWEVHELQFR